MDKMKESRDTYTPITKTTSLSTLILWNISKALEKRPDLNLEEAVKTAQRRMLDSAVDEVQAMFSDSPSDRYLACAVLAWQQLGHRHADSLCRFVESKINKTKQSSPIDYLNKRLLTRGSKERFQTHCGNVSPDIRSASEETSYEDAVTAQSFKSYDMGPVVKLPVETKIVMRVDTPRGSCLQQEKKSKAPARDVAAKINKACCLDTECIERLNAVDAGTNELRQRVTKLAWREAERVELLERAEAAWLELEKGYQRRLSLAIEKEEDIAKQIAKTLEERNGYKNACIVMEEDLKNRTIKAEKDRVRLKELEKIVCERACHRMKLSEESARCDAAVAEHVTKAAQLDRDLMFKEEQKRRDVENFQDEIKSMRILTSDLERATRSELHSIRAQIAEVSNKLLDEDAMNVKLKEELNVLTTEKMELIEDLEGCKIRCDEHMQARMETLTEKREKLSKLREKVMECRCKLPVDQIIEVKRTPSLAALCKCSPEDKILESCSCTSMRTKMLSDLFADLFDGLQTEMAVVAAQMPCQLLKCLEDKHNWDRASTLNTNLKNFFSRLLAGELDIAIVTAIESYHAKWVGRSCADAVKMIPGPGDNSEHEGWEQRAVERRAQTLAAELAEQLFEERAEELIKRARDIVESGPPPCECRPVAQGCDCGTMKPSATSGATLTSIPPTTQPQLKQVLWHRAAKDVTQLRLRVEENFKKVDERPVKDTNNSVVLKYPKEHSAKNTLGTENTKASSMFQTGTSIQKTNTLHKKTANGDAPTAPCSTWEKAMQHVAKLGRQIDNLKKEAVKKQDLKIMEDNIAKLISKRSTKKTTTKIVKNDILETANIEKIDKAVNRRAYYDTRNATKKKIVEALPKVAKPNPILVNGIRKTYKKHDLTYAVNVCLCSTKRQTQKIIDKKNIIQAKTWKNSLANGIFPLISSKTKPEKPINSSYFSQDLSVQTYSSEETSEQSCPNNCVCFHKVPSNTSIVKLLDTLTEWKGNAETSSSLLGNDRSSRSNFSKTDMKYLFCPRETISLSSYQHFHTKTGSENLNLKTNTPMEITYSEYIGDVNLEKSNDICQRNYSPEDLERTQNTRRCKASSKCRCAKVLQDRKIKADIKNKIHKDVIIIRKDTKDNEQNITQDKNELKKSANKITFVENMSNSKERCDCKVDSCKGTDYTKICSDYQIKFLGVTLTDTLSSRLLKIKNDCRRTLETRKSKIFCNTDCQLDINNHSSYKRAPYYPENTNITTNKYLTIDDDLVNGNNFVNQQNSHSDGINIIKRSTIPENIVLSCISQASQSAFKKCQDFMSNTFETHAKKDAITNFCKLRFKIDSCVCCKTIDDDNNDELENNAFNLFEEYLKQKVKELQTLSCGSWKISPEEETTLYVNIVEKVKRLIIQSINQISSKCGHTVDKVSKESWNRAYELLKEYLNMKIRKIQCSCSLEEDNKNSLLPDILNKISNLVDNDFQRLKNIYCCDQTDIFDGSHDKQFEILMNKQNEYDDHSLFNNTKSSCKETQLSKCCLTSKDSSIKDDLIDKISNKLLDIGSSIKSTHIDELSSRKMTNKSTINIVNKEDKTISATKFLFDYYDCIAEKIEAPNPYKMNKKIRHSISTPTTVGNVLQKSLCTLNNNIFFKEINNCAQVNSHCDIKKNMMHVMQIDRGQEICVVPYIGYTINCTCDHTLGYHGCPKNTSVSDKRIIDIYNKSITPELHGNTSYIMHSQSLKHNNVNIDSDIDSSMKKSEEKSVIENSENKPLRSEAPYGAELLKTSLEKKVVTSHVETNTAEDNESIISDCSANDVLDWEECSFQYESKNNEEKDRLKRSIYFPVPIENFDTHIRKPILKETCVSMSEASCKACACEMVPICHVKMLVESIENKLFNFDCTCDSLLSKVCPVHSTLL